MTESFTTRKIIHIDMDAFYAAVEQRDNPALRNKPLIIGGLPNSRGVVSTCSYEARKYGVHSAMASSRAYKLCPSAVFMHPNMIKYKKASLKIHAIFHRYTDVIEPLSLDEAFLDVTTNKKNIPSATHIAEEIRQAIKDELALTASAGVSYNKFLAKVASDFNKPDGTTVITPKKADLFLKKLPIGKFFGIGKVTEKKMKQLGIHTGADLQQLSMNEMQNLFGKPGSFFYHIVRGIDLRPVDTERIRKSLGKEITLEQDISDIVLIKNILEEVALTVEKELKKQELSGYTLTLKIKYWDFKTVTRCTTTNHPIQLASEMLSIATQLLKKTEAGQKKIRLLGITISKFNNTTPETDIDQQQLSLPL